MNNELSFAKFDFSFVQNLDVISKPAASKPPAVPTRKCKKCPTTFVPRQAWHDLCFDCAVESKKAEEAAKKVCACGQRFLPAKPEHDKCKRCAYEARLERERLYMERSPTIQALSVRERREQQAEETALRLRSEQQQRDRARIEEELARQERLTTLTQRLSRYDNSIAALDGRIAGFTFRVYEALDQSDEAMMNQAELALKDAQSRKDAYVSDNRGWHDHMVQERDAILSAEQAEAAKKEAKRLAMKQAKKHHDSDPAKKDKKEKRDRKAA